MWRHWLKTGSASVLAATRLDRIVAGVTGRNQQPLVLGYHRVVPEFRPDPTVSLTSMDISRAMLAAHLDWVARRYRIVPLDELGRLIESGEPISRPTAAVTVDDGYRDAYEVALPLFRSKGIPAAFFLVTDFVGTAQVPLYDRLYYQLARGYAREGTLPRAVWAALALRGVTPAAQRRIAAAAIPYDALQSILDTVTAVDVREVVLALEGESPMPASVAARLRCIDWTMARAMVDAGMTLGSHTRQHVLLNREGPAIVQEETSDSRRQMEAQLGRAVLHFAYPAGRFDPAAVRAVAAAGYRYAYTACQHHVASHPLLTIPRKVLWERACTDGDGRFSPSVMSAQISGLYDLVSPQCTFDHGLATRSLLATAAS